MIKNLTRDELAFLNGLYQTISAYVNSQRLVSIVMSISLMEATFGEFPKVDISYDLTTQALPLAMKPLSSPNSVKPTPLLSPLLLTADNLLW